MIGNGIAALVSTTALQQKGTASAAPAKPQSVGSQSVVCMSWCVTVPPGTGAREESVPRTKPMPCTPPS